MRPTFASFYVAKGGLDAANANLSITGQNMTNAKAKGYTRQRVDLYSTGPTGWKSRYAGGPASFIGDGVTIGGVNQLRDPYLDVRFRGENAKVGD
ncbi:MAG: flagellar hook-associated protein FlgK, partial [Oscillospiraceae bacterium]